jgi:hypothetical protein
VAETPAQSPAPGSAGRMIADAVLDVAGRATLPLQAARKDKNFGTAFWYNDLVEAVDDRETIRQYLVTSEPQTRYEIGQFTLREGLITPELPADELVLPGFARKWAPVADLGVAVMPTVDLHIHAERKGWAWAAQEITAGLAARPEDIAALDERPLPAWLLGHEVEEPGTRHPGRPQVLVEGTVTRTPEGIVRWSGPLPLGCAGAPVFAGLPHEEGSTKLICLGLALPGAPAAVPGPHAVPGPQSPEGAAAPQGSLSAQGSPAPGEPGDPAVPVTLVTFDRLRPAIHTLTPPRVRHWWQRGR